MVNPGSTITIGSCGLFYSVVILLLMVVLVVVSIASLGWKLDLRLGGVMALAYILFVTRKIAESSGNCSSPLKLFEMWDGGTW